MSGNELIHQLNSVNEKSWLACGQLNEMMGVIDQAVLFYEKVLSQNPANLVALMQVGHMFKKQENYQQSAECYQRVLNWKNNDGQAWANLGFCYLMMNDLQNAYSAYQHALYHITDPKDPHLWYGIGLLYDKYNSLQHAEEAFDALLKVDPNFEHAAEVRLRIGMILKQQGKLDESLERFGSVIRPDTSIKVISDCWLQVGHVYELKSEKAPAGSAEQKSLMNFSREHYKKVVELCPSNVKAVQQYGWISSKLGEADMAIEYLKRSIALDEKDANGWYLLGRTYMGKTVRKEATTSANGTESAQGKKDEERSEVQAKAFESAYHAYKQAVNCNPSNPNVWCSLGVLFYQLNQYMDALDAYSRAINLNPNICEVWYNVGTLYDTCQQYGDACDAYQKATDLGAESPFIKERLSTLRNKSTVGKSLSESSIIAPRPSEPPLSFGDSRNNGPTMTAALTIPGAAAKASLSSAATQMAAASSLQAMPQGVANGTLLGLLGQRARRNDGNAMAGR